MSKMYILFGKDILETDDEEIWSKNWANNRRVLLNKFGNISISTVFLGIDHSHGGEIPVLFETMVFGGEYDQYQQRYNTYDEAILGHEKICDMVNKLQREREKKLNNLGIDLDN